PVALLRAADLRRGDRDGRRGNRPRRPSALRRSRRRRARNARVLDQGAPHRLPVAFLAAGGRPDRARPRRYRARPVRARRARSGADPRAAGDRRPALLAAVPLPAGAVRGGAPRARLRAASPLAPERGAGAGPPPMVERGAGAGPPPMVERGAGAGPPPMVERGAGAGPPRTAERTDEAQVVSGARLSDGIGRSPSFAPSPRTSPLKPRLSRRAISRSPSRRAGWSAGRPSISVAMRLRNCSAKWGVEAPIS